MDHLKSYLENLSEDELQRLIEQNFEHEVKRNRRSVLRTRTRLLEGERTRRAEFEERLAERYQEAFDLYELMLIKCRDAGAAHNRTSWGQAEKDQDFAFEALRRIHTRACVVGSEIRVLMLSGYASGALARWRTLHEMAITALFIQKHGTEAARRYMAHDAIRTLKDLERQHAVIPIEDEALLRDMDELREARSELVRRYGKAFKDDFGWTAGFLDTQQPTFAKVEKSLGFAALRPRYGRARDSVHAGYLGMVHDIGYGHFESDGFMLAGPSNAGLVEPGTHASVALVKCTVAFLGHNLTDTSAVQIRVLLGLMADCQEAFIKADKRLKRDQAQYGSTTDTM